MVSDLRANMSITKSEYAQRLAFQCFSVPEPGRIDRGREAMMVSGLREVDLTKEALDMQNKLPEWRKKRTGKFAGEKS